MIVYTELCSELLAQTVYSVGSMSSVGVPEITPVWEVERAGLTPSKFKPKGNAGLISHVSMSPPAV